MAELKKKFTKKEMCYYVMINKFYKQCPEETIKKMLNIINSTDNISLRILDWFVTRYSKKDIDFMMDTEDIFDVHINYKAQLKTFKKKYFDPFRRKYKFDYTFELNNEKIMLNTTLGQLNFFAWAITNNILSFVDTNLQQITRAMNLSNKEDKKNKILKQAQSESESDSDDNNDYNINISTIKQIKNDEVELTLTFD